MKRIAGLIVALLAAFTFREILTLGLPIWVIIVSCIFIVPAIFWGLYMLFNNSTVEEDKR